ncbi:MAG: hypothetical protein KTR15_02480 [Phycisphaeraceae bacterium]|nr:hypothetical protein [Phycisphaeraceae bacterium]
MADQGADRLGRPRLKDGAHIGRSFLAPHAWRVALACLALLAGRGRDRLAMEVCAREDNCRPNRGWRAIRRGFRLCWSDLLRRIDRLNNPGPWLTARLQSRAVVFWEGDLGLPLKARDAHVLCHVAEIGAALLEQRLGVVLDLDLQS